jgi:hypothetical protein
MKSIMRFGNRSGSWEEQSKFLSGPRRDEVIRRFWNLFGGLLLLTYSGFAAPITLNIPVLAPYNNANAGWFLEYTSGDPALRIKSVTVSLSGGLVANTGSCLFSQGCGLNTSLVAGANVGTPGFTGATPAISNGATSFKLNFSGFNPGERFRFLLDLDDTNPNDTNVTATDLTSGNNVVNFLFEIESDSKVTPVSGSLTFVESLDISPLPLDGVPVSYARGTIQADVALPEPGTWALMGSAFLTLGLLRRRTKS